MRGESSVFSGRPSLRKIIGFALIVVFVLATLWVSPVQAETDTGCTLTITAFKFEDKDGDGIQDDGEGALKDWTFTLTRPNNTTATKMTNSQGKAVFSTSCSTGTYTLTETLQSGWYNTTPLSQQWTYSGGQQSKSWTANFGNAKYSKITVRKFEDKNGNGSKDSGEGWLNGWTFTLYNSSGNQIGSDSTSGSDSNAGTLTFGNLTSGTYTVTETVQSGYLSTTGVSQSVVLGYDQTKEIKFGNAKLAEICVYKFEDLNGDGDKDEGEPYLPGWTFKLYDNQNNLIGSGTTGTNGKISFLVFVPFNQTKTFKAVETPQDGYYPTTPTEQTTGQVSYGGWADLFFGNAPYGEIKVDKFEDLDGDGNWDEGEPPLSDWKFDLSRNNQVIASGITDGSGSLIFGGLQHGSYTVTEQESEDYSPTTPNPQSTTVAPGQQATLTFGNQRHDMDYGDLPEQYGLTLFSEDGARHRPNCAEVGENCGEEDVWLGDTRDDEYDGQPHNSAFGDDPTNNDEDGVTPSGSWGGGMGKVVVKVSGGPACLMGWVDYFDEANNDFGNDGQFSESFTYNSNTYTEKVIDNIYLTPGTHQITFVLPPNFANTSVFARFRLLPYRGDELSPPEEGQYNSCDQDPAGLTGLVIGGEVEDYYWQFGPTAVELKKMSAASPQPGNAVGLAVVSFVASLAAAFFGRRRMNRGGNG
ncbi:MAG: SpaA isopeptide-forming pilin-related protein [Anaerolineales bacterium]|nr:SpaA isopeptide-forming pilin-related protein [Anaerolineales bacterium]MDW8162139.1 SdrD B-like domain-containing protein [Anaerolineales bacterium]